MQLDLILIRVIDITNIFKRNDLNDLKIKCNDSFDAELLHDVLNILKLLF